MWLATIERRQLANVPSMPGADAAAEVHLAGAAALQPENPKWDRT